MHEHTVQGMSNVLLNEVQKETVQQRTTTHKTTITRRPQPTHHLEVPNMHIHVLPDMRQGTTDTTNEVTPLEEPMQVHLRKLHAT